MSCGRPRSRDDAGVRGRSGRCWSQLQQRVQIGFVRQWIDVQAVQCDTGGGADRGFAAVCVHALWRVVAAVVELDHRGDAEVATTQHEVGGRVGCSGSRWP